MATVHDVAKYILNERGPMSAMKLQKLVYYSQAWHLVWDEETLFDEQIQAWANGPVAPDLYKVHRGKFTVHKWPKGDVRRLGHSERSTIDIILDHYGDKPGAWLSELTHSEAPWSEAREGLPPGARSSKEITAAEMAEYYGGLVGEGTDV